MDAIAVLDTLFAYLDAFDPEDDPFIRLDAMRWHASSMRLELEVRQGQEVRARWAIHCDKVFDYRFEQAYGELDLEREHHPMLRSTVASHPSLYFFGRPESADALIVELLEAHMRFATEWIPFGRYLNRGDSLRTLFSHCGGQLATGPEHLLRIYADVLELKGLQYSMIPGEVYPPRMEMPRSGVVETAVLTFGRSFVLAEAFMAERLS